MVERLTSCQVRCWLYIQNYSEPLQYVPLILLSQPYLYGVTIFVNGYQMIVYMIRKTSESGSILL